MTSELDIYRSANLLIDQHGEDAPIFAAMQADKCFEGGDLDGKAVWMRVRSVGAVVGDVPDHGVLLCDRLCATVLGKRELLSGKCRMKGLRFGGSPNPEATTNTLL